MSLFSFNSRSPSGLRHSWSLAQWSRSSFNSRSPSGLRHSIYTEGATLIKVSIHAAQTGCDTEFKHLRTSRTCFNSRSPSGLRPLQNRLQFLHLCFNSRSPSGLRLFAKCPKVGTMGFNSRSPSGLRQGYLIRSRF